MGLGLFIREVHSLPGSTAAGFIRVPQPLIALSLLRSLAEVIGPCPIGPCLHLVVVGQKALL